MSGEIPFGTILLFAVAAGLANLAGAVFVLARRRWHIASLDRFLAFSAGFLMAVALLELVPESLAAGEGNVSFILLGFIALYLVERFFLHRHVHHGGDADDHCCPPPADQGKTFGLTALIGMSLHTFFDGVSITAGFAVDVPTALLIFLAVLLHKIPDGLVIASLMLAAGEGRGRAYLAAVLLALSTVAGSIAAWFFMGDAVAGRAPVEAVAAAMLAFSAGIFLYVAASDLIPEVKRSRDRLLPAYLVLGILFSYALIRSLIPGQDFLR